MTMGMTALWIGVVVEKPRMRMPSMSDGSRPSVSKATGRGSYSACGRVDDAGVGDLEVRARAAPGPDAHRRRPSSSARRCCCAVWEFKIVILASAEGDDAPDRIVGRDADGHAVSRHHLDSKAAHAAAQLGKHLVTLVTLHAVKTAAVDRHDRALHINQIILAQLLSFPIKDCATLRDPFANSCHRALRPPASTLRASAA